MANKAKRPSSEQHMPHKRQKQNKTKGHQASAGVFDLTGSHEEILATEVRQMLALAPVQSEEPTLSGKVNGEQLADNSMEEELPERHTEVKVEITELSSTGDGLGRLRNSTSRRVYVVPFSAPGDTALARVRFHENTYFPKNQHSQVRSQNPPYTNTDLIRILQPSSARDDSLIKCRYFTQCSGCQFQHLPYQSQLTHKRSVIQKAYANFSSLPASAVPEVDETVSSPLQYGYRTKLTPHFDGPQGGRRAARRGETPRFEEVPPIGFMRKGTRKTMDIEECPIATEALNRGIIRERKVVAENLSSFKRGKTILLRESTRRVSRDAASGETKKADVEGAVVDDRGECVEVRTCVSDNNAYTTEYVDEFIFRNQANAFFQNNNSILPKFTAYIRDNTLAPSQPSGQPANADGDAQAETCNIRNLIDAYCGSGLFTIALSPLFHRSIGVDISEQSVSSARENLLLNKLGASEAENGGGHGRNTTFTTAQASAIFAAVPETFAPRQTVVLIDPPRKGCDEAFLRQLLSFEPERVMYVSCNVHTQARDVGWILRGGEVDELKRGDVGVERHGVGKGAEREKGATEELKGDYEIESLRGFDFFPQTGHVESVAVLRRRRPREGPGRSGG